MTTTQTRALRRWKCTAELVFEVRAPCTKRRAVCAEPTRATAANQPVPMLVPGCAPGRPPQLLRQHPAHLPRCFFSYLESQGGFVASWFRGLHRAPHAGAMLSSRTRLATPARRAQDCLHRQLYGNAALYDPGYFCARPLLRQDHGAACTVFDKRWTPFLARAARCRGGMRFA